MKVILVRQNLSGRHMLQSDRVIGICRHGIAGCIVMGSCQQRLDIGEHRLAELDGVRCRRKLSMVDWPKLGANTKVSCGVIATTLV
jgi:hypothetical protein